MITRMQQAKLGKISDEIKKIALEEGVDENLIVDGVAKGQIVILGNNKRKNIKPVAMGDCLRVKVSANINATNKKTSLSSELDKVRIVQQAGADMALDFCANGINDEIRQAILAGFDMPIGTIPTVQAGLQILNEFNNIEMMTKEDIFNTIKMHCEEGVDFIMVHCGLTKSILDKMQHQKRFSKFTSHAANMLACWMKATGKENPLFEYFDELLEIVKLYDVTLLLGGAFKSASTLDASDSIEVAELIVLSDLIRKARMNDVQVMIEGLGQVSLNKIPMMVQNINELTDFTPLYVIGANACDCAVGYDNITTAIGGALAAYQGADVLSAITSVERIGFAHSAQIREGVLSARIAAHCADLARGNKKIVRQNNKISFARKNSDWKKQIENSIDKSVFEGMNLAQDGNLGIMCGDYSMDEMYNKYFS